MVKVKRGLLRVGLWSYWVSPRLSSISTYKDESNDDIYVIGEQQAVKFTASEDEDYLFVTIGSFQISVAGDYGVCDLKPQKDWNVLVNDPAMLKSRFELHLEKFLRNEMYSVFPNIEEREIVSPFSKSTKASPGLFVIPMQKRITSLPPYFSKGRFELSPYYLLYTFLDSYFAALASQAIPLRQGALI